MQGAGRPERCQLQGTARWPACCCGQLPLTEGIQRKTVRLPLVIRMAVCSVPRRELEKGRLHSLPAPPATCYYGQGTVSGLTWEAAAAKGAVLDLVTLGAAAAIPAIALSAGLASSSCNKTTTVCHQRAYRLVCPAPSCQAALTCKQIPGQPHPQCHSRHQTLAGCTVAVLRQEVPEMVSSSKSAVPN